MVRSPHVCELAIACAYIVLDQANPIKIIANLVAAHHKKNQLKEKDLDLLFIFLKMRLAVSVINSTMMAKENPDELCLERCFKL